MLNEIMHNVPMMLALTLGSYLAGVWVRNRTRLSLLHPFLICIPVIVAVLKCTGISSGYYMESNKMIDFMLGPSVVSLGLLMYDHLETIRKHLLSILVSVFTGSAVGVGSVYLLCRFFRLDSIFSRSLEAKSVTTPIAMDITASLGGNVSLAAVSVILCGFIGWHIRGQRPCTWMLLARARYIKGDRDGGCRGCGERPCNRSDGNNDGTCSTSFQPYFPSAVGTLRILLLPLHPLREARVEG